MKINCSSDREKLKKIFEITRTIYSNSERSEQSSNLLLEFLIAKRLEQLDFKLEKIIGV